MNQAGYGESLEQKIERLEKKLDKLLSEKEECKTTETEEKRFTVAETIGFMYLASTLHSNLEGFGTDRQIPSTHQEIAEALKRHNQQTSMHNTRCMNNNPIKETRW